jgi:phage shock protein E
MSKRSRALQNKSHRYTYMAMITGVLVIVGILFLTSGSRTAKAAEAIAPSEYQSQFVARSTAHILLDVRTPEEFASGHIHGAVNISVESLANRLNKVPMNQPIVVYCRSGNRSAKAVQILAQAGYSSLYDLGGLNNWLAQGFSVE